MNQLSAIHVTVHACMNDMNNIPAAPLGILTIHFTCVPGGFLHDRTLVICTDKQMKLNNTYGGLFSLFPRLTDINNAASECVYTEEA